MRNCNDQTPVVDNFGLGVDVSRCDDVVMEKIITLSQLKLMS